MGLCSSSTATKVKYPEMMCLCSKVRKSSASTLTPTSIDVRQVLFTEAIKTRTSPLLAGLRKWTESTPWKERYELAQMLMVAGKRGHHRILATTVGMSVGKGLKSNRKDDGVRAVFLE